MTRLTTTGTAAPTTPAVGATTAALRPANPRYRAAIPIAPETPAREAQPTLVSEGIASRRPKARRRSARRPEREARATTWYWELRRAAKPPAKSPPPPTTSGGHAGTTAETAK